jgi:hypothetical protein
MRDYGLGVRATVVVVLKLKRGSAVLSRQAPQRDKVGLTRQAPWSSKVVLLQLPLWCGSLTMYALKFALYYGSDGRPCHASVPVAQWSEHCREHNLMCLVRREAAGTRSTLWPL